MRLEIFKQYIKENKVLNYILILTLIIIILSPSFDKFISTLDSYDLYNYYLQTFVNISLGFIVSLLFYIIVVFLPETKRKLSIKGKTHIIFARLQPSFINYIEATLGAFNLETGKNIDVLKQWKLLVEKTENVYSILNREIDETEPDYIIKKDSGKYLNLILKNSTKILKLKQELISFLIFLDEEEVDLYRDIEDLFIFENISDIENGICVDFLFLDEFPTIIEVYMKTQMIVKGKQSPLVYNKRHY